MAAAAPSQTRCGVTVCMPWGMARTEFDMAFSSRAPQAARTMNERGGRRQFSLPHPLVERRNVVSTAQVRRISRARRTASNSSPLEAGDGLDVPGVRQQVEAREIREAQRAQGGEPGRFGE